MAAKRGRVYWRETGGARRAYVDIRDYADVADRSVNGKPRTRFALVAKGASLATTDPKEAEALASAIVVEMERRRKKADVLGEIGVVRAAPLQAFAAHHLCVKAESGRFTDQWLSASEQHLRTAVSFFGKDRELHTVTVSEVQRYAAWLLTQPVQRGRPVGAGDPPKPKLSASSVRKYLNTLSNLYRRAQSEGVVPVGYNPVGSMMEKPVAVRREAAWLESHEIALLLESARTYRSKREDIALPFLYPLLATFALTGGRESEILGLEVDDVSFDRRTVTFRPNGWRRLKTATSFRTVPLWPQLEEVLRAYLFGGSSPRVSGLLFPSHRSATPAMLTDWRKALDAVAMRAGWKAGEVRSKQFRHGYCAARLQSLDRGEPVSTWTVAKELGHGGDSMVRRVYGHLGTVRHRSEWVEYRVDQHLNVAGFSERLRALAPFSI